MPNESVLLASTTATEATGYPAGRYMPITHVQQKLHVVPYYWDPIGLAYVVAQQAGSSGGTGLTDAQLRASAVPVSLATNTPDVTDRVGRLLGHVTVDSAPTTAVTNAGTFAVQATGTVGVNNFPATQAVSNAGTFAVQSAATLAAETTKVIGTVNVAAGQTITATQATGTNLHVVVDSAPTTAVTAAALPLPAGAALEAGNLAALVQYNAGVQTDLLSAVLRELRITNYLLQSGLNVSDDLDLFRADPSYSLVS